MTTDQSVTGVRPELLAPAGNWECAYAAVANGADAIYFGLDRFNARLRADNFTLADLPLLMNFLHARGVKGYVTMNTLVFSDEMNDAIDYVTRLNAAGADGVIVQDIGLAVLIASLKLKLELHASTQMTITSPEALKFVNRFLPLKRAVLARELSMEDIRACAAESNVPLEIFVHGALCVAYSGQCLTSESLGQRSANRGECAQACRMPYSLIVDGKNKPMGERRYLVSPQDLCSIDLIADMVEAGVKSYKIEGRLKSPEYVAAVTKAYRGALDAAMARMPIDHFVTPQDRYAMQMVFSRGFTTGWLEGTDHPGLTHGKHGKKRGALVGEVKAVGQGWVDLAYEGEVPLAPGDGFVFDAGEDRNAEQGGRIWKVQRNRLFFHGKGGNIDWSKVASGQKLWKTDDPALNAKLRKSWNNLDKRLSFPVSIRCSGSLGNPLTLMCPEYGVCVATEVNLEAAVNKPLDLEVLKSQLGRLGGTDYVLKECTSDLPDGLMLPLSVLNKARRDLVEIMNEFRPRFMTGGEDGPTSIFLKYKAPESAAEKSEEAKELATALSVLCRHLSQIEPVLSEGVKTVYLDFEDIKKYRQGVETVREHAPDASIFIATPRIQKPGETGFFKLIEKVAPDGVLIRNLGGLEHFVDSPLRKVGDFSLNVANPVSAGTFLEKGGLERVAVSYDLNAAQVLELLKSSDPAWYELTLHQHMPMFHMEHCVFCAFLSKGHSYKDCGRPCESCRVELKDRVGQKHPLLADAGCRNTLYNGKAQTGAPHYREMSAAGLRHYRVELLHESPEMAKRIIRQYQLLLKGSVNATQLIDALGADARLGVTNLPR